ncbi:MAG TPA: HD domain-containing phosphohydrolase [Acidimicrobiia bacterium]|nr:HD domain-containing phosphohydrolase [Acidimicrobiia bacterium]
MKLLGIEHLRRRYWRLQPAVQRRLKIAVPYFALGIGALVVSAYVSDAPDWRIWILFTGLFVLLELFTVEVNDRLFHSSSIMVVMTAGVIFALQPESSAMFAMALMAGLGAFVPDDFKERRWFQPMANFGQLALSGAGAGLVLDLVVGSIGVPDVRDLFLIAGASIAASLVYTTVQTLAVRRAVQAVYPFDRLQPWSHLGTLLAGQFIMGLLGGLIGGAFLIADRDAILVLIVGVYAIGHMSLYAFSQLRVSHLSAIKGFVKTLEAKDMYTRGHTERVAYFAEMIGEEYGFNGTQIEVIKWAALIHDLGKLAVPTELIRKRGRLDDEEYAQMKQHAHLVEEILAEVDFLQPMVEIASGHHSHYDGNGYGGRGHSEGETPSLETCIVAVADAFDAMTSARSYRMALSQRYALSELRKNSGAQFHPEVVDAFERALDKSGKRWGAPHVNNEEMARRLAEEPELTLRG